MNYSTRIAISIGLFASAYLGTLAIFGDHGGSILKYGKYLILIAGLIVFYNKMLKHWAYKEFLGKYIGSSARISLISGFIIVLANSLLFAVSPDYSIQKYSLLAENATQLVVINTIIIIETVVLGMLSSFVIFPYFKNTLLDNRGIHQSQPQRI